MIMADLIDQAQERIEREERYHMERSRVNAKSMKGEQVCRKCGGPNDRYHDGYVVCSDCVEQSHL